MTDIFAKFQKQFDEEASVQDAIKAEVLSLERQNRAIKANLSLVNATLVLGPVLKNAYAAISNELRTIEELSKLASKHPFYKYHGMWTREIQDMISCILLMGFLGGYSFTDLDGTFKPGEEGRLLKIQEVAGIMGVAYDVKDEDVFHITLEEYLHALITLMDDLERLAMNSVTLNNLHRPLLIGTFIRGMTSGFQLLNLKNGDLRRRSDSIKYKLEKVENIIYQLRLKSMVPTKKL